MKLRNLIALPILAGLMLTGCKEKKNNSSVDPVDPPEPPVEPVQAEFPVADVISFFDELGIEITLPAYTAASEEVEYEVDTETEGYFDVYVNDTTSAELVSYKDALKEDGWVVISENEETSEDFKLAFGETDARVDLLDYTSYADEETPAYNLVSFYVYSEEEVTYTVEEAINYVAGGMGYYFTQSGDPTSITDYSDEEGPYFVTGVMFLKSDAGIDDLKPYGPYIVPAEFALVQDWTAGTFSDGTPKESCYYLLGDVVIGLTLYNDLYTDGETEVTVFQAAAYSI